MELIVHERGDSAASGLDSTSFRSISEWKQLLTEKRILRKTSNAHVYELVDPHGDVHYLSLARWASQDPDSTYLMIEFRWRNPKKVGLRQPVRAW